MTTNLFGVGRKLFILTILSSLAITVTCRADDYFETDRKDTLVPADCKKPELNDFAKYKDIQYVTFSIEGGKQHGFNFEIPLSRDEITLLWQAVKSRSPNGSIARQIERDATLKNAYDVLKKSEKVMGFTWGKEGDILESLAIASMRDRFPENAFFITGGLAYHNYKDSRTIGELDVVVGHADTCEIVLIGEAKENVGEGNFARSQLRRFAQFIQSKLNKKSISLMPELITITDEFDF